MESAGISLRRCTLKLPLAHPFFSSPAEVMEIQWTRSSSLLSPGRINPCCSVGRRFFPQLHTSPVLTSLQAILCTHCSFSEQTHHCAIKMEFPNNDPPESSEAAKNRKRRERYASNEERRAEINSQRRIAYATMDPEKKRKMLDEANKKRRAAYHASKALSNQRLPIAKPQAAPAQILSTNSRVANLPGDRSVTQSLIPTYSMSLPSEPSLLKQCLPCHHCEAVRIQYEPSGFCCSAGQTVLVSNKIPPILKRYFYDNDSVARQFKSCVRTYNNTFSFTSLGVHNYDRDLARIMAFQGPNYMSQSKMRQDLSVE
ncbi:unnamed protein product [Cuscuta epithymum]|uniref:BZIP domain-containing protein n=1 Tax=Cuscuta epithymum TaxID=186058 RepID=A0AAV0DDU3_9ASTE|nr:unnamed protein product [Cuscuta epithymum]